VRGNGLQRACNRFENAGKIAEDIIIPEPKNPITFPSEPSVSCDVPNIRLMLSAIDFDNKTSFATYEVDNVRPDGFLPHELKSEQAASANVVPQTQFCVRRIFAKPARTAGSGVRSSHRKYAPHPARSARRPLPASGERLTPRAEI
jgi:hypothetical protein